VACGSVGDADPAPVPLGTGGDATAGPLSVGTSVRPPAPCALAPGGRSADAAPVGPTTRETGSWLLSVPAPALAIPAGNPRPWFPLESKVVGDLAEPRDDGSCVAVPETELLWATDCPAGAVVASESADRATACGSSGEVATAGTAAADAGGIVPWAELPVTAPAWVAPPSPAETGAGSEVVAPERPLDGSGVATGESEFFSARACPTGTVVAYESVNPAIACGFSGEVATAGTAADAGGIVA